MSVISVVPPAVIVICVPSTVNTAVFVVSFPAASFANAEIICCPSPNEYAVVSYTLLICSPSKITTNVSKVWSSIKYSLQGTTQGRYLTGGVPPVRFSM